MVCCIGIAEILGSVVIVGPPAPGAGAVDSEAPSGISQRCPGSPCAGFGSETTAADPEASIGGVGLVKVGTSGTGEFVTSTFSSVVEQLARSIDPPKTMESTAK